MLSGDRALNVVPGRRELPSAQESTEQWKVRVAGTYAGWRARTEHLPVTRPQQMTNDDRATWLEEQAAAMLDEAHDYRAAG